MKLPEPKTWSDDIPMSINPSSNNYKMGFNDAIREVKKLNEEAPKPEPSKEVTENEVLELAQWIAFESGEETSPEKLADALYKLGYRRRTPNAKNNEGQTV